MEEREPYLQPLRSVNSQKKCLVYFRNNSRRPVKVRWLNYQGQEQQYFELQPQEVRQVNTFVTHPWIFRDAARNTILPVSVHKGFRTSRQSTVLVGANLRVFHPPILEEQEVAAVVIWDQVYSLRELCYQKFIDMEITFSQLARCVPLHAIEDYDLFRTGLPLDAAVRPKKITRIDPNVFIM